MHEDIVELQTRLAFQDDLLQDLNAIVTQQQRQIDQLAKDLAQLKQHLQTVMPSLIATQAEETPPPHY